MNRELPDLYLERRIMALHNRYLRVIDDDRLEAWPGLFTEAGRYQVITRENHARQLPLAIMSCEGRAMMEDRVTGLRRINVYEPHYYRHHVSGLQITRVHGPEVECISNFMVVRTMVHGAMSVFATGIYRDSIIVDEQGEFFRERVVVTDSCQVDTLLVIPL